ncbi:LETM1-related biofilm-associated protein [Flavobacterium sp. JP2137]|uniref:LETM1-related biofilm-associated protein n=1 Tax=Flavobacterium sp. JP2137 TaxID=3414510 RepID=UPI003D2FB78F
MNPSTSGWIRKYFKKNHEYHIFRDSNLEKVYRKAREIGFAYGYIDAEVFGSSALNLRLTQEELSKICLLQMLEKAYYYRRKIHNHHKFIAELLDFYQLLTPHKKNYLDRLLGSKNQYDRLEKAFKYRWSINLFSSVKNQGFILNNILLLVDLLAFDRYLVTGENPKAFSHNFIELLINIVLQIKDQKVDKNENDVLLIKYLQKTLPTAKGVAGDSANAIGSKMTHFREMEKKFLSDFITINSWNNDSKTMREPNLDFLDAYHCTLSSNYYLKSQKHFYAFLDKHQREYYFFKSSNLFNNLVKSTSSTVELILIRNKKRLIREIYKNGHLMNLLLESTKRELDSQERKQVKKQLLEICKTIPSLTIFLLPGGSLVLPIILKFIPQLLPSSFNENL